jgi:hypothetical protein
MTGQFRGSGPIANVEEGMRVLDSNGEQVGTVATTKLGDPGAVTEEGQRMSGGLMSTIADTVAGSEPDVEPQFAAQLLRTGYVKIDAKGFFASDLYAGAEQIEGVDSGEVRLSVPREQLVRKG